MKGSIADKDAAKLGRGTRGSVTGLKRTLKDPGTGVSAKQSGLQVYDSEV